MIMVVVTYDVCTEDLVGQARLRRVAKLCESYGQRVQYSVFECLIQADRLVRFKARLQDLIDPTTDSLRFYHLGDNWKKRIEHIGAKPTHDPSGPLVV